MKLKIDQQGDQLVADADGGAVDFELNVPSKVDVGLSVGSGNVSVAGVEGDLVFDLGSGDLKAQGGFSAVEGKLGMGNISINGLMGRGKVKLGKGRVELAYSNKAEKGDLEISTGMGDVDLLYPEKTQVDAKFSSGSGRFNCELENTPKAPFRVLMRSGIGNLSIKRYH
ncbi:MAG: DUF4097 domain-containing protein [Bdellovibrionaceae bacterium]|nr:DUF4097 domain-containing protein [Pseudobdellovibrionaceae bacterium]